MRLTNIWNSLTGWNVVICRVSSVGELGGQNQAAVSSRLNIKRQPAPEEVMLLDVLKELGMLVSFSRVARSHDAATHAHNGVFSLWPLPTTLYFLLFICPSVCCCIFLPAASLHLSLPPVFPPSVFFSDPPSSSYLFPSLSLILCSSTHPSVPPSFPPHVFFPRSRLTGRFIRPQGGCHNSPCGWVRGLRGVKSPG